MTLQERLRQVVTGALPGTMVPVESLATLLDTLPEVARTADGLSLEEVGAQLHARPGTVRKYIREGKRGKSGRMVLLKSFPGVGGQRVTEEALAEFIQALQAPAEADAAPDIRATPGMSIKERIELGKRISAAQRGRQAQ